MRHLGKLRNGLSPCPCCGEYTISEVGTYEICDKCGWEDDPLQFADPDYAGGANVESLNQCRAKWMAIDPTPERLSHRKRNRIHMGIRADFERLCSRGEVSGPVSVQEIDRAQAELGVQFPIEYRDFLKEFGAVLAGGVEIYGLPNPEKNDPPLWQCVVSVTRQLRSWEQAGTDRAGLVPISDDGTGIYFFLDTAVSPETQIWAIGPGVEKLVSSNFYGFFVDLSEGKIAF